jgi:homogentisate 1,2-dioxygenase
MRRSIPLPRSEGATSRQAHADLPAETYERELGRDGFFGPASHMYHRRPPTGWIDWEGPLRPRAYDLNRIERRTESPWQAATVLHNAHVRYRYWRCRDRMPALARNADGDDLLFLHAGRGALYCDYGHLDIRAGDYIVIPRGTMWRTEFDGDADLLLIEATNGGYGLPDKGIAGAHAIFDPAVLDTPRIDDAFRAQQTPDGKDEPWRVEIKRGNEISTATFPYNPLDAIGWHGDLAPVRLNVEDIRPIVSPRYHLPPSVHTTFVADRFVVCTFAPRPIESDPGAIKIPFFHNNDDYDEVIFYHAGDFFSRDDIDAGMVTFHPCGFTHGPHPKALQGMLEARKPATDEYAVMLDARDALTPGDLPAGVENADYVNSWRPDRVAPEAAE